LGTLDVEGQDINHLKAKQTALFKAQHLPRSKHFSSLL